MTPLSLVPSVGEQPPLNNRIKGYTGLDEILDLRGTAALFIELTLRNYNPIFFRRNYAQRHAWLPLMKKEDRSSLIKCPRQRHRKSCLGGYESGLCSKYDDAAEQQEEGLRNT